MINKAIRMLGRKMARYGLDSKEYYPDEPVDGYYESDIGAKSLTHSSERQELNFGAQMFFKIYTASGGYILEFRKPHNPNQSKHVGGYHDEQPSVYVINQDADITEEIALICKKELLTL